MAASNATFFRDGLRLTGPRVVKAGSYIRVRVTIERDYDRPHDAWADAVDFAYAIYGAVATEDNTVGQVAQVDGVDGSRRNLPARGRTFSLGLNLYGVKVREVNARIRNALASGAMNADDGSPAARMALV